MYKTVAPSKVTSLLIPVGLLTELNEMVGYGERNRFILDAIRDAIEERKTQQKANEPAKYQLPLTINQ